MWFFKCPEFFFGEDALSQLEMLPGKRAFIVTDANIARLGFPDIVQKTLANADIASQVFAEVEPDPSLQTVQRGAEAMLAYEPDWIIGLGGGSSMDAAKAMWILYERPGIEPESISPMEDLGLRQKAKLICIPTTAGTGSESNYGIVLTDTSEKRKLTLGSREATPDIAIVDPMFTKNLPAFITADTGIDVLSHAIEAYSCGWANDFTDGLCLQAARMVFQYLPRAVADGPNDEEAREKMANAASIAGITLGNSQVALAHALGHSAGALFKTIPHGRITAIFLPYTIEFVANGGVGRYADLAAIVGQPAQNELEAAQKLANATRSLMRQLNLPTSLHEAGISATELDEQMETLVEHVMIDTNTLMSRRIPEFEEIEQLFHCAFNGRSVDF
ncbi:MAG: iron-containing alcohol dehydrogenase [Ardenticatenaceae bacterium]|nr:iron-containing alcohol dehydrogenase [Anaerolineales bacterium]MCB8937680.1 iron-containing alcohol dehydrogenase [Ardenticatenaceae bacterium]MCB8974249.1 iron-containing alcohol dehydrogenase [Ardenticatenaceae bacterium]